MSYSNVIPGHLLRTSTDVESQQHSPDTTRQQPSSASEASELQSLRKEVQRLRADLDVNELRLTAEIGKKTSAEKALAEAYALRSEEIRGLHAAVERERELVTLLYAQIASLTPTTEVRVTPGATPIVADEVGHG